jgi:YHS domain-containing protein
MTTGTKILQLNQEQRFHTVCKRVFKADPSYFPQAEYHGKKIYFCTESCLNAFLADPERFYCAHSQPISKRSS